MLCSHQAFCEISQNHTCVCEVIYAVPLCTHIY